MKFGQQPLPTNAPPPLPTSALLSLVPAPQQRGASTGPIGPIQRPPPNGAAGSRCGSVDGGGGMRIIASHHYHPAGGQSYRSMINSNNTTNSNGSSFDRGSSKDGDLLQQSIDRFVSGGDASSIDSSTDQHAPLTQVIESGNSNMMAP
jgi:hypothetical protein